VTIKGGQVWSRIEPAGYSEIRLKHYDLITQFPLINAVVSNIQDGFVCADTPRSSFFVSTKSGFSLCSADVSPDGNHALFEFLKRGHDIPNYLHLYNPTKSLQEHVERNWDKYKVLRRRAQFRYEENRLCREYEHLLPAGCRIATVQEAEFERLEETFQLDLGHRYWNGRKCFITQAIGACILDRTNAPLAICYSACIVDGIAEMDILVLPEHRNKGFMKLVSGPCFNLALRRHLAPHWDTFISNAPSYHMAKKFGLRMIREYDLLSLLLR
jgi:GNAT superfamily N-acetyltransferase